MGRFSCSLLAVSLLALVGCNSEMAKQGYPAPSSESEVADGEHIAAVFTSTNFQREVLENPQVVLVDCWAPWCGPCVKLGPTIEQLAREYQGKAVIGKLNVDDAQDVAAEYQIDGIPALLFFRNGEEVDRLVGLQSKSAIAEKLDGLMR